MRFQQFHEPEPTNKFHVFMFNTWSNAIGGIITGLIFSTLPLFFFIFHSLNFNWFIFIVIFLQDCFIAAIAVYAWRTRTTIANHYQKDSTKLEENYRANMASLIEENETFKTANRELINNQIVHWNEWAVGFTRKTTEEQFERLQEMKRQLDERIGDVNSSLATRIQNNWNNTTSWENAHTITHGQELKLYKHYLVELEKKLIAEHKVHVDEQVT